MKRHYAILVGCNKLQPKIVAVSETLDDIVDVLKLKEDKCHCLSCECPYHPSDPDYPDIHPRLVPLAKKMDLLDPLSDEWGKLNEQYIQIEKEQEMPPLIDPELPEDYKVHAIVPSSKDWYRLYKDADTHCPHALDCVYIISSSRSSDDINEIMESIRGCIV